MYQQGKHKGAYFLLMEGGLVESLQDIHGEYKHKIEYIVEKLEIVG